MMKLFADNMDGKIVISTSTKHVVSYICKYALKPQLLSEHNTPLCQAAFAKASRKVGHDPKSAAHTDGERGARILSSMMYSLTNSFEIAAPMCNLYLLRGSPSYQSHEPIRVNVVAMLHEINSLINQDLGASKEINISEDRDHSTATVTPLQTYWHRPHCLQHVHFAELQEEFHVIRGDHNSMGFLPGHPQSGTHHFCRNAPGNRKVIVLVGVTSLT
jgi:hypothetical protein